MRLFIALALAPTVALAGPLELTWQVRMLDSDGVPYEGEKLVEIELWSLETGGTELWDDNFTLTLEGGYDAAVLGTGDPLTTAIFASGEVWVQVRDGIGGPVIGSRQRLAAVPRAVVAEGVPQVAGTDDADCTGNPGRMTWNTSTSTLEVCDGTTWNAVMFGRFIVSEGGVRRYSDGTAATTCNAYRNPASGSLYIGSIGDGLYQIDPDGPGGGAPFTAYCDMTTDDGGWTQLHMLPSATAIGIMFSDHDTCGGYTQGDANGWGYGTIMTSGEPSAANHNCYSLQNNGLAPALGTFEIPFFDRDGTALPASQIAALSAEVATTVYDGDHYHWDIDAPAISEPIGPYGETGTGPINDGGGGYVIFPSKTNDPATGADFYISDSNNPHGTSGGATDHEALSWLTIANGLVTHWGVQDRSNNETSAMDFTTKNQDGGGRGVLTSSWFWVR